MTRLRTLLLVSMLGNLFAVGVIAGGLTAFSRQETVPPVAGPAAVSVRTPFDAGAALPPAAHARFVAALRDTLAANRPLRRDARRQRSEAAALLTAPVFDRDATAAALDRARADDAALRQRLDGAALDFAATLGPEERARLADGLTHRGLRRVPRP